MDSMPDSREPVEAKRRYGYVEKTLLFVLLILLFFPVRDGFTAEKPPSSPEARRAAPFPPEEMKAFTDLRARIKSAEGKDRIPLCDELIARFGEVGIEHDTIYHGVTEAVFLRADLTEDDAEAFRYYDEYAARAIRGRYPGTNAQVAHARERKAMREKDPEKRIELFGAIAGDFDKKPGLQVQSMVASALYYKARAIEDRNRGQKNRDNSEAIELYDYIVERFHKFPKSRAHVYVAFSLTKKASSLKNIPDKIAVLDRLIDSYKDDTNSDIMEYVAWAMNRKAKHVSPAEAEALRSEVVARYGDSGDASVQREVFNALQGKARQLGGGPEAFTLYRDYLESPAARNLTEGWRLRAQKAMADSAPDAATKDMLLDELIAVGSLSGDKYVRDIVNHARLDKAAMTKDRDEAIRLYDEVLRLALGGPEQVYLISTAAEKRAELAESTEEKIAILEAAHAAITKHDARVGGLAFGLALRAASLQPDPAVRARLYDDLVGQADTPRERERVLRELVRLAEGDEARKAALDRVLEGPGESKEMAAFVVEALVERSRLAGSRKEKLRLLDRAIAMADPVSGDNQLWRAVKRAISEKALVTGDRSAALQEYDALLRKNNSPAKKAQLLMAKANESVNSDEKLGLYSEVVEIIGDSADRNLRTMLAEAHMRKAMLVRPLAEKIALYDAAIALFKEDVSGATVQLFECYKNKADILGPGEMRQAVLDEAIACFTKNEVSPYWTIRLMMKKAEAASDPREKMRIYDEVIASSAGVMGNPGVDAMVAKARLLDNDEEKIALLDQALLWHEKHATRSTLLKIEEIVRLKADALRDPGFADAYFSGLAERTTDPDLRIQLLLRNTERLPFLGREYSPEDNAVYDAVIAEFKDNPDPSVRRTVANVVERRAKNTGDPEEKRRFLRMALDMHVALDEGAYRRFHFSDASIARLNYELIQTTEDVGERLRLYDEFIEKNKSNSDFMVKGLVDKAIAARFRLADGL